MSSKTQPDPPPSSRPAWHRIALWIAVFAGAVFGLHYLLGVATNFVSEMNSISGSTMAMIGVIAISLMVYAVLIALPFMPGIEVGIALLLLQGASIAPFVYLATVIGLMCAYLVGNTIPLVWLRKLCCDFGLNRLCAYLDHMSETPIERRLVQQRALLPAWLAKITVDYRYLSIGILLNLPGTFAIGGGGGILMAAGLSRLFNGWAILLTLGIATLPVPLTVWVLGVGVLFG